MVIVDRRFWTPGNERPPADLKICGLPLCPDEAPFSMGQTPSESDEEEPTTRAPSARIMKYMESAEAEKQAKERAKRRTQDEPAPAKSKKPAKKATVAKATKEPKAKASKKTKMKKKTGAAAPRAQLMSVKTMLRKKIVSSGPITLDHHRSKDTRITRKGLLLEDGTVKRGKTVHATCHAFVQDCLKDHVQPKCNPFHVLFVDGKSLDAIRDGRCG